jgi:hypothetical protein
MINLRTEKKIILTIVSLTIISFFFGFIIDENSAGGGDYFGDIRLIWGNQKIFFKNTLVEAIAHEDYLDSRSPLAYIIHAYFNFYSENIENYRKSVFIISLTLPVLFFFYLKEKFNVNIIFLVLISSIILLSPFFRTTSYWALQENYGLIFLVLTSWTILKCKHDLKNFNKTFFICFFSCLTFYFDQKLLIIPILSLFFIMNNFSIRQRINSLVVFSVLALPYIYFISVWGGIIPTRALTRSFTFDWENIGYMLSIIGFYVFPFALFKKDIFQNLKIFFLNRTNIVAISLIFTYLIFFAFYFESFEGKYANGNGIVYKISEILFEDLLLKKLFICFSFLSSFLIILIFFRNLHDRLIIIFFLILSLVITPIYQEYLDPLIFVMLFTFFKEKIRINFIFCIFLFSYYFFFFLCSFFYYKTLLY